MKALLLLVTLLLAAPVRAEDVLHLYNWNSYLSDDTVQRFEAACKCRVKQDYYSDNEEMLAKLDAGATGYDVIVPTGNAVESLIRRQALRPLDKTQLPQLTNLKREFLDPWYDPGNRYSLPYATTVTLPPHHNKPIKHTKKIRPNKSGMCSQSHATTGFRQNADCCCFFSNFS